MKARAMHRKKKNTDERGFTLIEVLIAMALFAVGMLATISMEVSAVQTNKLARNSREAGTIAADLLERLNSLPYDDANYLAAGTYDPAKHELREGQSSAAVGANLKPDIGTYNFVYNVTKDTMIPNTKTITITVSYLYKGTTRNIQLVSVKPDTI
jgi:type IV pilus assembly protein PilV